MDDPERARLRRMVSRDFLVKRVDVRPVGAGVRVIRRRIDLTAGGCDGILGAGEAEGDAVGVGELLSERDHVLVALDGPVAEVLSTRSIADRLRVLVSEDRLPPKVARTEDPFVVLAYAGTIGPATERAVYAQWRRIEHEVAAAARVAVGVHEAFASLAAGVDTVRHRRAPTGGTARHLVRRAFPAGEEMTRRLRTPTPRPT